jgi:translocation and assembly module TamB
MPFSSTSKRKKWYSSRRASERSEHEPHEHHGERKRSPRRWRRLVILLAPLVVVVWLLPMLIAHSPLLNWIVAKAAADLDGKVVVGSASLGWFSPIRVSEVEVRDAKGQPVLTIPQAKGDASLLGLLWDSSQLGTFRLEKPQLQVVLTADGSNVEQLIAKYLTGPSGKPRGLGLEIIDGAVSVQNPGGGRSWKIEQLQLSLRTSAEGNQPMEMKLQGVIPEGNVPGVFDVEWKKDASHHLVVKTKAVPIERFDALVARFASKMELAGRLTSQVECQWGDKTARDAVQIRADALAEQFLLAMPALGTDRIQMPKLKADCAMTIQSGKVVFQKAKLDTDVGAITLAGNLALGSDAGQSAFDSFLHQTYQVQGRIDLARLATMMPKTLHILEGTKVTSGELSLDLASQPGQNGMTWKGNIRTSDLTAMRRGKELVWQQPIVLTLDARETKDGPVIENLKCESHFLTLKAAGRREDLAASLEFDLDRLVERLGGFVNLGSLQMKGNGWTNLTWRRDRQNAFMLDADMQIRGLQLAVSDRQPWQEESLVVLLSSTGRTTFGADTRLDTAELEIKAGTEQLLLRLVQPVNGLAVAGPWPVTVDTKGDLARWIVRARAWDMLRDWDIAGTYRLRAEGVGSTSGVELRNARFDVEQLRATGHGLNVVEPTATATAVGQYVHADRRMLLKQAELNTKSLAVRASEIIFGLPKDKPMELAGNLSYRGDLGRLQQWMAEGATPRAWCAAGQLTGEGRLKPVGGVTTGQLDSTIQNLLLQSSAGKQFAEPTIQLTASGVYDQSSRMLRIEQLKLAASAIGGNAQGQVADLGRKSNAQLAGQINYDLDKVSTVLRPYLGNGVQFAGRGSRPITLGGPLNLGEANATAGLDWTSAYVYGFRIGAGQLRMALANGILQIDPLDLPVSEGRVHLVSRVRMAPGPMELHVDPGPLVQQVRIDPEMCAFGLQYLAPVLAGVATAQGKFSIELEGCRLPIDNPGAGELAGRFTVHSVEIGAGPLLREFTILLQRESAAKLTRESVIQFRMVNGRVYHQGLELVFPELTIRTQGSVGLDQSLAMVAEMPIPPKWLAANTTISNALRNQTIQLPIGGTLSRPQIDRARLDQYSQQFLRKATEGVLQNELNKQFDRLLQPRK